MAQQPTGQSPRLWESNYVEEDVKTLYDRGAWRGWDDILHWLDTKGLQDRALGVGEAKHLAEEIRCLAAKHVPFTEDYREAYRLARAQCSHH